MSAEAELACDASQMHFYPRMETPYVKALMAKLRRRQGRVSRSVGLAIARRAELRRMGMVVGGAPAFGYERKRRAKDGLKVLVRREPEASLMVEAFERAAAEQ